MFHRFLEETTENIEGHFFSCSQKGSLVRWGEALLMRQAGVAEKAVDHLLVTETFAGPDHIDYQGERNGQR